jgi:hypothetical protein
MNRLFLDPLLPCLAFGAIYMGVLFLAIRPFWDILKKQARFSGGRFQFSTLDFLAAALGLTPTAWLAAASVSGDYLAPWTAQFATVFFTYLFWFVSQLAGMVIVVSTNKSPSRKAREHFNSAAYVFFGALAGLTMPLVAPCLAVFYLREVSAKKEWTRRRRNHSNKFIGYSVRTRTASPRPARHSVTAV